MTSKWQDRLPFWRRIVELTNAYAFLDVGCGEGWNMLALRSINPNFEMSGLDVIRAPLLIAKENGFDVDEGPTDQIPELFGDRTADLIAFTGDFKHIAPEDFTRIVHDLLNATARYVLVIQLDPVDKPPKMFRRVMGARLTLVEAGECEGLAARYWLMEREQ